MKEKGKNVPLRFIQSKTNLGSYSKKDEETKMNNKAFTLIEVLIALVLLAFGLLALAGMQITAVRGNFFSNHLTQASYVGQDGLETLNSLPVDSAALQEGSHSDGTVTVTGIVFNRSYTVTVDGEIRTIIYAVSWNDGVNRRISFATIRSI